MATITEAHHIAVLLHALADHDHSVPTEGYLAESITYLDERAAKALQLQRIIPAAQVEPLAREIAQRAADRCASWERDLDARAEARDEQQEA